MRPLLLMTALLLARRAAAFVPAASGPATPLLRRPSPPSPPSLRSSRALFATASGSMGSKTVLVPVADGSEEIESVTIIDVLVRAGNNMITDGQINAVCGAYSKVYDDIPNVKT